MTHRHIACIPAGIILGLSLRSPEPMAWVATVSSVLMLALCMLGELRAIAEGEEVSES